jgi:deoxycytidylate deaminase
MPKVLKNFEKALGDVDFVERGGVHVAHVGGITSKNTPDTRFCGENVSSVHAEARALKNAQRTKQRLKWA